MNGGQGNELCTTTENYLGEIINIILINVNNQI
jgi:hypothetical protein